MTPMIIIKNSLIIIDDSPFFLESEAELAELDWVLRKLVNLTSSLILDSGLRVKEVFNRLLPGVPM